jgi:hypothetical protein
MQGVTLVNMSDTETLLSVEATMKGFLPRGWAVASTLHCAPSTLCLASHVQQAYQGYHEEPIVARKSHKASTGVLSCIVRMALQPICFGSSCIQQCNTRRRRTNAVVIDK